MKKVLLVFPALIWILAGSAYAAMELSMDYAIQLALDQNETMKQAEEDQASAHERVKEARGALLPTVSASYTYNRYFEIPDVPMDMGIEPEIAPNGTVSGYRLITEDVPAKHDNEHVFGLTASQVLFTSGRVMSYYRAAKAGSESADYQVLRKKKELIFQVQESYLNTLLAREALAIARASLANTQKDHDIILQKLNEGLASEVEKMQHEVDLHSRRISVTRSENDLVLAKNYLKILTGISREEDIHLTEQFNDTFPDLSFEETLATVLDKEPSINALQQGIKANEYLLKAYKADYFPTVAAFSRVQRDGDSDDFFPESEAFDTTFLAGVAVTIPLYEGGVKSARKNQAIRTLNKSRLALANMRKLLTLDLENAFLAYHTSQRQLNIAKETLKVSQKAYNLAQLRYKTGLGSLSELQDAELDLTHARLLVSQTICDVNQNLYKIQSYLSNGI